MFQLNENYALDGKILRRGYILYSPEETSTFKTPNSLLYINIPREDSVICL